MLFSKFVPIQLNTIGVIDVFRLGRVTWQILQTLDCLIVLIFRISEKTDLFVSLYRHSQSLAALIEQHNASCLLCFIEGKISLLNCWRFLQYFHYRRVDNWHDPTNIVMHYVLWSRDRWENRLLQLEKWKSNFAVTVHFKVSFCCRRWCAKKYLSMKRCQ